MSYYALDPQKDYIQHFPNQRYINTVVNTVGMRVLFISIYLFQKLHHHRSYTQQGIGDPPPLHHNSIASVFRAAVDL